MYNVCFVTISFKLYFIIEGYDERKYDLQPFATLNKATLSLHGKSVVKLGAPSLLNDYCKRK